MSDHEKCIQLCKDIKNRKIIISAQEQERIDKEWVKWGMTSTQKRNAKQKDRTIFGLFLD